VTGVRAHDRDGFVDLQGKTVVAALMTATAVHARVTSQVA
jgi:hypothetical protein